MQTKQHSRHARWQRPTHSGSSTRLRPMLSMSPCANAMGPARSSPAAAACPEGVGGPAAAAALLLGGPCTAGDPAGAAAAGGEVHGVAGSGSRPAGHQLSRPATVSPLHWLAMCCDAYAGCTSISIGVAGAAAAAGGAAAGAAHVLPSAWRSERGRTGNHPARCTRTSVSFVVQSKPVRCAS